jgi:hypothetical protein
MSCVMRFPEYERKFPIILSQCGVLFVLNMTNLTIEFFMNERRVNCDMQAGQTDTRIRNQFQVIHTSVLNN